jgi:hypothetical protein
MCGASAASQFLPIFEQAQAGKPIDAMVARIDVGSVNLAEETPAITQVLTGNDPELARRAMGLVLVVLSMRQVDDKVRIDARALLPLILGRYDEPEPSNIQVPIDSWRQIIMYMLLNSNTPPSSELVDKMKADLTRQGGGSTSRLAAIVLSHFRPIPSGVVELLLSKMAESEQSKLEMIEVLGANHVEDPRVVRGIALTLSTSAAPDVGLPGIAVDRVSAARNTNVLHRAAAQALGQIGAGAKESIPALKSVLDNQDPSVEEVTRQVILRAIASIQGRN